MELIYTCSGPKQGRARQDSACDLRRRWLQESVHTGMSSVSSRNVLLFTSTSPHPAAADHTGDPSGPFSLFLHRVFLCDLNTPWDLHLVTARSAEVTCLAWDESGSYFSLADSDGGIELWHAKDHLLSRWTCVAKEKLHREIFLQAKFIYRKRMVSLEIINRPSKLSDGLSNRLYTVPVCISS